MEKPVTNKYFIMALCLLGFLLSSSAIPYSLSIFPPNKPEFTGDTFKDDSQENPFTNIDIMASSTAVLDVNTGEFIYKKNSSAQLPLASITKVMSGISTMRIAERIDKKKTVKFAGKFWDLYDLMKFSLVSSSNSGVANIAEAISKTKSGDNTEKIDFVSEMNSIAKELGLRTVYFINETGLDETESIGGGYGSAEDVSKMFAYAIKKYPEVFSSTKNKEIKIFSEDGEERISKNTNFEVDKMTTLIASKTGTTDLAGGNLVIAFDAEPSRPIVICILSDTPKERFSDVEKLTRATIEYLSK